MRYRKGFTLIELMTVVVIVAILAAVAIAIMRGRIDAAKWSEGKAGAGTVATTIRAYFTEKGISDFDSTAVDGSLSGGNVNLGIADGEKVKIVSRRGEVIANAKITETSPVGVVFMTFHFAESPTNVLTNPALDPVAKIPEFKVCAVRIEKNGQVG